MPFKNGRLSRRELRVAEALAATGGDVAEAARRSGSSVSNVYKATHRPAIQAMVRQEQQARLFNEILPLAIEAHIKLLTDPATPAGARAQAVGLAYKHALPGADLEGKDPSEMTGDELARELQRLKRELSDRAKPVLELKPAGEVFG